MASGFDPPGQGRPPPSSYGPARRVGSLVAARAKQFDEAALGLREAAPQSTARRSGSTGAQSKTVPSVSMQRRLEAARAGVEAGVARAAAGHGPYDVPSDMIGAEAAGLGARHLSSQTGFVGDDRLRCFGSSSSSTSRPVTERQEEPPVGNRAAPRTPPGMLCTPKGKATRRELEVASSPLGTLLTPQEPPAAKRARVEPKNLEFAPKLQGGSSGAIGETALSSQESPAILEVHSRDQFWQVQIEAIYRRRNPYKLKGVPALLSKYKGNEVVLYRKVCRAYDLCPDRLYADPSAWEDEGSGAPAGGALADQEPSRSLLQQLATLLPSLPRAVAWLGCKGRARAVRQPPQRQVDSVASGTPLLPRAVNAGASSSGSSFSFSFASGPSAAFRGLDGTGSTLTASSWMPVRGL